MLMSGPLNQHMYCVTCVFAAANIVQPNDTLLTFCLSSP